jgi:molecular chaperone GrpE
MTDAAKQLENELETNIQSDPMAIEAPEILEQIDDTETFFAGETSIGKTNINEANETTLDLQDAESSESEVSEPTNFTSPDTTDAVVSELTQTIESLKAQLEDRNTQYMRIAADFDNFRRRTLKEKEELEEKIKCTTISELLPVVDNFERARLQLKPQNEGETNLHKSYQSVYKQLVDCLKRVGVAPMRAEGKLFDPSFHEAVVREATNQHEEGTVLEELVRGYLIGERVLRHALVKVAVPLEDSDSSEDADQPESSLEEGEN